MTLGLAKLLMLAIIQGEILVIYSFPNHGGENIALISISNDTEEIPSPMTAFLPLDGANIVSVKKRRSIWKRSTNGRGYQMDSHYVDQMEGKTIADVSTDLPEIQNEIVEGHNKYRRETDPPAANMLKLKWNAEAAKTALKWALQCQLGHSPQSNRKITYFNCGENIFYFNYLVPWTAVILAWFSEYIDFLYGVGATSNVEIGHYTQIIWAKSYWIGCAAAECKNGPSKYVFVCHYGPAGNKGGRSYPYKKGKPCGDCPNNCDNKLCTNPCPRQDYFTNCPDHSGSCTSDPTMMTENCPASCQCTKGEIY
ncbi:cysteine-rich venom protein-like [Dendropsophus ebraccatus]|uniref:cysteine-rich venom protein-like n=1 Tax=Dendropsophus ebraccatus TaxID=150705 RepID=UPI003831770D